MALFDRFPSQVPPGTSLLDKLRFEYLTTITCRQCRTLSPTPEQQFQLHITTGFGHRFMNETEVEKLKTFPPKYKIAGLWSSNDGMRSLIKLENGQAGNPSNVTIWNENEMVSGPKWSFFAVGTFQDNKLVVKGADFEHELELINDCVLRWVGDDDGECMLRKCVYSTSSVADRIRENFAGSELTLAADNAYQCDTCNGLRDADKQESLSKLPDILCVHIRRRRPDGRKNTIRLLKAPELKLGDVNPRFAPATAKLVGVVNHSGDSVESGHYTATVLIGEQWWYFDDCAREPSRTTWDAVSRSEAFMLFYQVQNKPASMGYASEDSELLAKL